MIVTLKLVVVFLAKFYLKEAFIPTALPGYIPGLLLLLLLLAAMTYNQVHYFRINHLAG